MAIIFFDVTDIIHYATRYSRLTGIQRVQVCITNLLARKYAGDVIRCVFYDRVKKGMYEFDPNKRSEGSELDPEILLLELGLISPSSVFPSRTQVKSYLRRYGNKLVRTFKKIEIYMMAVLMPHRLRKMGVEIKKPSDGIYSRVSVSSVQFLPKESIYVCLGSSWLHPEVGEFGRSHFVKGGKVVQMVHDLIPISHPQFYTAIEAQRFVSWLRSSFEYTSEFLAISCWTAKALEEFAKQNGRDVKARPVALAHEFMGFKRGSVVHGQPDMTSLEDKDFVLCVGTVEHRKNGIALLKSWEVLIKEFGRSVPLLVFAGKYGRGSVEFEKYLHGNHALARHVQVIHAVSDQGLAWLYSNCLFTAMPSLTEGWGLPIGESAWFGKVCVTSDVTSMPEVCGQLAEYVDPQDVSSIHACVRRLVVDSAYRTQREMQISSVPLRGWGDVAEDIRGFLLAGGI